MQFKFLCWLFLYASAAFIASLIISLAFTSIAARKEVRQVIQSKISDAYEHSKISNDAFKTLKSMTAQVGVQRARALALLIQSDPTILKEGDVETTTVNANVTVRDHLTRLSARDGETKTIDDVVKATFKQRKQLFASVSLRTFRHFIVLTELRVKTAVKCLNLLLFTKLFAVFGHLAALHAVHSGRKRVLRSGFFEGASLRVATRALQKELLAFATASFADGA